MVRTRAQALIDRIAAPRRRRDRAGCWRRRCDRFGGRHRDLAAHLPAPLRPGPAPGAARARDLSPTPRGCWSAPTSATSTPSRPPRCATRPWSPHPDQTGLAPGSCGSRSACARSARATCPRSGSPPRSSGPATELGSPTGAGPLAIGQRHGRAAPAGPARRRAGRGGLRQRGRRPPCWTRCPTASTTPSFEQVLGRPAARPAAPGSTAPAHRRATAPHRRRQLRRRPSPPTRAAAPAGALAGHPGGEQRHGGRPVRPVRRRRRRPVLPGHLHRLRRPAHRRPRCSAATTCAASRSPRCAGRAPANKGMALFPRTVGGRHLALCRADGETIGLTVLDGDNRWQAPGAAARPRARAGS